MKGCVFCERIRLGQVDDEKWRSDVVSFEPLNPVTPGHRLFIPTMHHREATASPSATGRVFAAATEFARNQMADFNLLTSAGPAATQSVYHLHVHYVPRHLNDGLMLPWSVPLPPLEEQP